MNPDHSPYRVVGAYAAQPDDVAERYRYFEDVLSLPGVDGLEISWRSPTWEQDAPILAEVLSKQVRGHHVLTLVGAGSVAAAQDGAVGLASLNEDRRAQAVELVGAARQAVVNFMERGQRIVAVELHAFPSLPEAGALAGGRALEQSLSEFLAWDWAGAAIVIEHCDARLGTGQWQKGLLPLDVEIAAVTAVAGKGRTPVGMAVNWGRSAIEERDPTAPERHVRRLRSAGLLRGLMFSGATDCDGAYGPAWSDAHPPLHEQWAESIMNKARVSATLEAAGSGLLYEGVKIAARPPNTLVKDRVELIHGTLASLTMR